MSAWMLPVIVVLPLLSAAVVAYFRNTWSKNLVSWVACSSVCLSAVMVLTLLVQYISGGHTPIRWSYPLWGNVLNFGFLGDSLSLWWMLVVTGAGFLIHIYSVGYMWEEVSYGRFMAELNYFIFAMSLLVLSDNFIGLLMGWANVGLASYLLIGFYATRPSAKNAAIKAFVMNSFGEIGLFAGIAFIYKTYGTFKYDEVFAKVAAYPRMVTVIGLLLLLAAVAKSAQMPLHTWLPYAMEGPTPVSALIHAATMVTAGVYLVSRAYPIYEASSAAALTVAWIGGLGALFGSIVAAGQFDIKRVLAFSTLSQVGYMFMGNGLGAYVAADFHFLTHAFFKAALFLCAGIVVHHYQGDQDIRKMGGLMKKDPFAFWTFLIAMLALVGFPPFAGFFSKDEILLAALEENVALFIVGILAAGMTAFYCIRLLCLVFLGDPYVPAGKQATKKRRSLAAQSDAAEEHHATPLTMKVPVAILAALSLVGGWIFFPNWQNSFLKYSFKTLHLHTSAHINFAVAGLATAVALVGMGVSWYLYGPKGVRRKAELDLNAQGGLLYNMFYFDALYDALFVKPVRAFARFCGDLFDPKVVDGIVNGLGKVAVALGGFLRVFQNGYIRRYALSLFAGVALMLAYYIFYA